MPLIITGEKNDLTARLRRISNFELPGRRGWFKGWPVLACLLTGLTLAEIRGAAPGPDQQALPSDRPAVITVQPLTANSSARPNTEASLPPEEAARLKNSAVEVARQVAEAFPGDALSYALLGSAFYNTGRSEQATLQLKKCLELNPNQADAYEILARVAYEKGQLEEAVRLCQEALQRGPANPDVLNQLGRALMDLGRTSEAVPTLQKAVSLPRPVSESSYLLGQAYLQSGQYAEAKKSFLRAIELLPDHTQAYFGLFTACLRLGQKEEASGYRQQFQKLEAIDRRSLMDRSAQEDTLTGLPLVRRTVARTLFGAAQIYRSHQEPAKAAALYLQAASLDADNPLYRAALEAIYVQRKAVAEGVAAFEQLVVEQPDNPLNYLYLGRLYTRLEQVAAAEKAYRKLLELAPQRVDGYRGLAELYLRASRNLPEAQQLASRAVQLEPSAVHYYLLAVACAQNNDRPGALKAAHQAAALNPNEKRFRDLIQQLNEAP